jgi:putative transposase
MLPQTSRGRPRQISQRRIFNALWYVVVSGVQWRLLPCNFPKWQLVYYHFRRWQQRDYWRRIYHVLRALCRQRQGRHKHPTAGCQDSQSVKSTQVPGVRGFDSAKQIKGRKRHLLTDTQGLPLELVVTAAHVSDSQGARLLWQRLGRRRGVAKKVRRVWVDAGYKKGVQEWCAQQRSITLQVVKGEPKQRGFAVQPRRWVIERTFAWLSAHRRLARAYETLPLHSEGLVWLALTRLVLRRLA